MKVKVTGHVPTVYQMKSLSDLAGDYTQNPDGSFGFEREFNTVKEAKNFLRERAFSLLESDGFTNGQYREAMHDIKQGYLRYDAAQLNIEK
jgi:hypothetical protein